MSTSAELVEYVCDQIFEYGEVFSKRLFSGYMVYVNSKPLLLICNDTVFIKRLDCLKDLLSANQIGLPFPKARPWYILDADDSELLLKVVALAEPETALKKKRPFEIEPSCLFND
jgi:TfoX/Sxy family transcriptional regulator of competence genes